MNLPWPYRRIATEEAFSVPELASTGQRHPRTTTLKIWAWNLPGPAGGSLVNQIST